MDSPALTEKLDDVINAVIDDYVRRRSTHPPQRRLRTLIDSTRRFAAYDVEFRMTDLADEMAKATAHNLSRADANMTGCSPADRRSQPAIPRPRRRRHR